MAEALVVGGLPEVVTDGVNGILEAIGDVERMAARLCEVLGDTERARSFSHAARAAVEERFTTDLVVPQYEAAYEEALSGA